MARPCVPEPANVCVGRDSRCRLSWQPTRPHYGWKLDVVVAGVVVAIPVPSSHIQRTIVQNRDCDNTRWNRGYRSMNGNSLNEPSASFSSPRPVFVSRSVQQLQDQFMWTVLLLYTFTCSPITLSHQHTHTLQTADHCDYLCGGQCTPPPVRTTRSLLIWDSRYTYLLLHQHTRRIGSLTTDEREEHLLCTTSSCAAEPIKTTDLIIHSTNLQQVSANIPGSAILDNGWIIIIIVYGKFGRAVNFRSFILKKSCLWSVTDRTWTKT